MMIGGLETIMVCKTSSLMQKNLRKNSVLSTALSMIQNFAFLAFESAFFHGSATDVGAAGDVKLNDLFTFLAYQVCIYFFLFHFYDAHFFLAKTTFYYYSGCDQSIGAPRFKQDP